MENFFDQVLAYMLNVVFIVIGAVVLIAIIIIVAGKLKNKKDTGFKNH